MWCSHVPAKTFATPTIFSSHPLCTPISFAGNPGNTSSTNVPPALIFRPRGRFVIVTLSCQTPRFPLPGGPAALVFLMDVCAAQSSSASRSLTTGSAVCKAVWSRS